MNQPDIERTREVVTLFQTPQEQRDEAWRAAYFAAIPDAALAAGDPQLIQGPDGFPYAVLRTPERDESFSGYSVSTVLDQVTESGVGLVINPREGAPDWVFSYGDLLELRLLGELRSHEPGSGHTEAPVIGGERVMVGEPGETYLPMYARRVLAGYLKKSGIAEPAALLMYRPSEGGNTLVFPFTPEQFGSGAGLRRMLASISWFLPRNYLVMAMAPEGLHFIPLYPEAPPAAPEPAAKEPEKEEAPRRPWYRRLF